MLTRELWQRRQRGRYILLIDGFHKLSDNQRHTLDAFYLLLGPHQLPLQTPLFILDVLLLEVNVPASCQPGSVSTTGDAFHTLTAAAAS